MITNYQCVEGDLNRLTLRAYEAIILVLLLLVFVFLIRESQHLNEVGVLKSELRTLYPDYPDGKNRYPVPKCSKESFFHGR